MAKAHTVDLKGQMIYKEGTANAAIQPGDLIEMMSTNKYRRHATLGGDGLREFARENELAGKGIDTNYAAGDWILTLEPRRGGEVQANVAAAAVAIAIGDQLESHGDGTLSKRIAGVAIATALEAVDNSAGATIVQVKVSIL